MTKNETLFAKQRYLCLTRLIYFQDGTTTGDGTTVGKCPSSLNCLSTGECNVCKDINGYHEGCRCGTPLTPVCDGDSATPGIQVFEIGKFPICVACSGKCICLPLKQHLEGIRLYILNF